jgi:hypothetical protein
MPTISVSFGCMLSFVPLMASAVGWKLAFVIRGWAKSSLLDTYEEERRAYARELITLDQEIARAIEGGGHHSRYRRFVRDRICAPPRDYAHVLCRIWDEKNRFISFVRLRYHFCMQADLPSVASALSASQPSRPFYNPLLSHLACCPVNACRLRSSSGWPTGARQMFTTSSSPTARSRSFSSRASSAPTTA